MKHYPAANTTARILAERTIPYRPRLKLLTNNINAAILLSQINYWWFEQQQTAFYKFAAPCNHRLYKKGDSWQEELAFTRTELETALKHIGTKTHGPEEREALRGVIWLADGTPAPVNQIVLYWRDSDNVTWYELNVILQDIHLARTYADSECRNPAFVECRNPALPGNVETLHSTNVETLHYPYTEITTKKKNTSKKAPAAQDASSPASKKKSATSISASVMNPLKDAIAAAFGWTWDGMTRQEKGAIQAAAKSLAEAGATVEDVALCKAECDRRGWSGYSPAALCKVLSDVRRSKILANFGLPPVPPAPVLPEVKAPDWMQSAMDEAAAAGGNPLEAAIEALAHRKSANKKVSSLKEGAL